MRNFKNLLKRNKNDGSTACFGVPVEDVVSRSKGDIPLVVEHCVVNLDECGLDTEGLFRVSGSATLLQVLKKSYDEGKIQDRGTLMRQSEDCHAMAGLLKLWIRDLPEPLHTYALYDSFVRVAAIDDKRERTVRMRELMNSLPQANFLVLRYIMSFLRKVGLNSDRNKMSFHNLAVVFAPTVVRSQEENLSRMMGDQKYVNVGMNMLIEEADFLFNGAIAPSFEQQVPSQSIPIPVPEQPQIVPMVNVEKWDEVDEEAEKRQLSMMVSGDENSDKIQRRLVSKQVAHRNLDFTPEKDKSSRRPRLTIQTPTHEEQDLNAKFMISPARPPHSPSKSPHVHPIEYSSALLDLVSQTVNYLFEPSFQLDDTMHIIPTHPLSPPSSAQSSRATKRMPVVSESTYNLQENLRMLTQVPASPASDVSMSSTPSPTGPPSVSPTSAFSASAPPANVFAPPHLNSPTMSSSPSNRRLMNSSDSIFPPISPLTNNNSVSSTPPTLHNPITAALVRSASPSSPLTRAPSPSSPLSFLGNQHDDRDNSPRRSHLSSSSSQIISPQPLQPAHARVAQERSLSQSDSQIPPPRASLFEAARGLQNLPSPSSPSSPSQRLESARSLGNISPQPDRPVIEPTRSYDNSRPRSQLHISSTSPTFDPSLSSSPAHTASLINDLARPASTSPTPTPQAFTSAARQRSGSELAVPTALYGDTPRPLTSLSYSPNTSPASSPTFTRQRSQSEIEGSIKRNVRQRAASPNPTSSSPNPDWGKSDIYHVKRNRKTWAPENIQNIYEILLTNGGNASTSIDGSLSFTRREKDSSPRKGSASPRATTSHGSPRSDDNPLAYIQAKLERERKLLNRPFELQLMTSSQIKDEKVSIKRELREFDNFHKKKTGQMPKKSDKEILRPLYQRYRDVKDLLARAENPALPVRTASPRRSSTASPKLSTSHSSPHTSTLSVHQSAPNLQPFTTAAQQLTQTQQQSQQQKQPAHATNLGRAAGRRATLSFGYETPLSEQQDQQQQLLQQQQYQQQYQQHQSRTLSHGRSVPNIQKDSIPNRKTDLLATYKNLKTEKKQLQIMLHQYQNDFVKKYGRKVQFVEDREPVRVEYERYKDLKTELTAIEEQLLS